MANDSKRVSQLGIVTNMVGTDRIVVLTNPNSAAVAVQTIPLSNIASLLPNSGMPVANSSSFGVIKVGPDFNIAANGALLLGATGSVYGATGPVGATGPQGSITAPITISNTSSYTASPYDNVILVDALSHGDNIQIFFPTVGIPNGKIYLVKNISTAPSNFGPIVTTSGGQAIIEDPATSTLNGFYKLAIPGGSSTWVFQNGIYYLVNSVHVSGLYTGSPFTSFNTYGDGIVADYISDNGRISVGINDQLSFYTNGIANTLMMVANSSGLTVNGSITATSNTMNVGSSSIASNGYTYLPNGLKMNWGHLVCNTTSQVTFSSPFSTAVLSINVTPANAIYAGANTPYVSSSNTTTANIYSASTTTTANVYYTAIGY